MSMAFRNALVDLRYGYNLIGGSSVAFTFDSPKTFQPRRDPARKAELAAVNSSNRGLVSRYKNLGLGSNDPNLVSGDAAGLMADFTHRSNHHRRMSRNTRELISFEGARLPAEQI